MAVVGGWILSGWAFHRRLFSDAQLLQTGQKITALKHAALSNLFVADQQEVYPPDDPRVVRTEAGFVIVYTIAHLPTSQYLHRASVSLAGRRTAHLAGETYLLLWANLLGVEYARLSLAVSPAGVHHAEFVLTEVEQKAFAHRPVKASTADWLKAASAEWSSVRGRLKWDRFDSGSVAS